jgi:hypothetical protein
MAIENHMTREDFLNYKNGTKRNKKYNNKKTVIDGISFDSEKEAARYSELKILEKYHVITDLKLQYPFLLIPTQRDENGILLERQCTYKADFVYKDENGKLIVEDAKGFRTEVYKIKKKLMLARYGIHIKEI